MNTHRVPFFSSLTILGMVVSLGAAAASVPQALPVTGGDLARRAAATGEVEKGELTGKAVEYLRQSLKTESKVFGEAKVVKVIDDNCARVRIKITVPDVMVSYPDATNSGVMKKGPFETTTEGKFCDEYIK